MGVGLLVPWWVSYRCELFDAIVSKSWEGLVEVGAALGDNPGSQGVWRFCR